MNEKPIIFSGEMVRAILDGRKTQTRRVIKPQPESYRGSTVPEGLLVYTPYRPKPGDRLWVREKFAVVHGVSELPNDEDVLIYGADANDAVGIIDFVKAWRPSIFMPRVYSRITLEIVSVRVERLQDIDDNDAVSEGIRDVCHCGDYVDEHGYSSGHSAVPMLGWATENFSGLWDSINGKRYPWELNPWVWVVEFKRVYEDENRNRVT